MRFFPLAILALLALAPAGFGQADESEAIREYEDFAGNAAAGEEVRRFREANGWSQRTLAWKLGISVRHLGAIESGEEALTPELRAQLGELSRGARIALSDAPVPLLGGPDRWFLRFSCRLGASHMRYRESLGAVLSDFEESGLALGLSLEFDTPWFSPFFRLQTAAASGDETFRQPGQIQFDDLDVSGTLIDLGAGYRVELTPAAILVPSVAYTAGLWAFERSRFVVNGVPVVAVDLDGVPLGSVDEDFHLQGVTGGLELEISPRDDLVIRVGGAYTYVPWARVVNDIGGTTRTSGYIGRAGVSLGYFATSNLAIGLGYDLFAQVLKNSDVEFQSGLASAALVQLPDNRAIWGTATLQVSWRF